MTYPVYQFDDFELDPAGRELRRGGVEVSLPPKSFECIVYLVENRARAVGRDELISAVWGQTDLSDNLVHQTILVARRALDDSSDVQRTIKTVRGFGYHWVVPTERIEQQPESGMGDHNGNDDGHGSRMAGSTPFIAMHAFRRYRIALFLITLAVGVLIAVGSIALRDQSDPGEVSATAANATEDNIAILLPVLVASEADHAWMRLGIMELIADRLRAAGQPMAPSDKVIALAHGLSPEPTQDELGQLTTATGARLLLQARAEKAGSKHWRVSVRSLGSVHRPITAVGEAEDVLVAARAAADHAALSLGHLPPPPPDAEPGLALLVQQVTAALLAEHLDLARELIENAPPDLRGHPELRFQLARIDYYGHRFDESFAALEGLVGDLAPGEEPVIRARALNGLGLIRMYRGDHDGSENLLKEAIAVFTREDRHDQIGQVYNNLGVLASGRGDLLAAGTYLAQARAPFEENGNAEGLVALEANLGVLEAHRGRWAAARDWWRSAANRAALLHKPVEELRNRASIILAELELLDAHSALNEIARLDELLALVENPVVRTYGKLAKTKLLFATGHLQFAELLLDEVDAATEGREAPLHSGLWVLAIRAEQAAANGDLDKAAFYAGEAVDTTLNGEIWLTRRQGYLFLILVRAHLGVGDRASAASVASDLSNLAEANAAPAPRIYAALAQAELAAAESRMADARAAFDHALALADTGHSPKLMLEVAQAYVSWLLAQADDRPADQVRAIAVAGLVARFSHREYSSALLQTRMYHDTASPAAWVGALDRARALAGERQIPPDLMEPPPLSVP